MLPFLKDRHEGGASETVDEHKMRKPDDGEEYGMLDALSEDMLHAIHKKDKRMFRDCLEALIEHMMDLDEIQDQEQFEE